VSEQEQSGIVLLAKLTAYFLVLGGLLLVIFQFTPELLKPGVVFGSSAEISETLIEGLFNSTGRPPSLDHASTGGQLAVLTVLFVCFTGTVLLMLPITWVYMNTHPNAYRRNFITALIILPICATATVWLIQGNLALAFGLAALVAAVRFRIRLNNPLDGVYVFSSISVGLASGVGHLGVAFMMVLFFCYCAAILWIIGYGRNPRRDLEGSENGPYHPDVESDAVSASAGETSTVPVAAGAASAAAVPAAGTDTSPGVVPE
jgi:NADH:ubiquinone oxidoreductase subunit 3 (subunit A)